MPDPFESTPRSELRGFERIAVPICDAINTWGWLKTLVQIYVELCPRKFVRFITSTRRRFYGLERIQSLEPPAGVILVSNHRSFFDMYVCSAGLYDRASFMKCLSFPVRGTWFYTSPLGIVVNFLMSGCAMWPPVYRDERKKALNPISMKQMIYALSRPGGVLGIHPEGTRNKGADPYSQLPTRPGVGRLVKACPTETLVLPFFVLGMTNSFFGELRRRLFPSDDDVAIRIRFGEPLSCGELQTSDAREITDRLMGIIAALGEEDRAEFGERAEGHVTEPATETTA